MDWERAGSPYTKDQTGLTTDEKIASLFQPDVLLSTQFETLRRKTLLEPEKRLMLAILEDAVTCFQEKLMAQRGKNRRLFEEAEDWIVEVGGDGLFSFDTICETLGINPEYVRRGLLRWKDKRLPKRFDAKVWEGKMAGWLADHHKSKEKLNAKREC
jgi:hypothetical protein